MTATLTRTLRTTEYFTLAFGAMVGVGWLVVMDDWLARGGPGGAMLGFLLGGLGLAPIAYVYGKFVRAIPSRLLEVPGSKNVRIRYFDESGKEQKQDFSRRLGQTGWLDRLYPGQGLPAKP